MVRKSKRRRALLWRWQPLLVPGMHITFFLMWLVVTGLYIFVEINHLQFTNNVEKLPSFCTWWMSRSYWLSTMSLGATARNSPSLRKSKPGMPKSWRHWMTWLMESKTALVAASWIMGNEHAFVIFLYQFPSPRFNDFFYFLWLKINWMN